MAACESLSSIRLEDAIISEMEPSVQGDYLVLPDETLCGGRLAIRNGRISSIDRSSCSARLSPEPTYVLPGLIDTHSDAVELAVEPRLGADVPYPIALHALETVFISGGITTCFHALHTLGVTTHRRSFRAAGEILDSLESLTTSSFLRMSHLAILRCELPDCQGRSKSRPLRRRKREPVTGRMRQGFSGEMGLWSVAEEPHLPRSAFGWGTD